jgi:hypothetical protein
MSNHHPLSQPIINQSSIDTILTYLLPYRYSPNGKTLAMASADGKVYLHAADNYAYLRQVELPVKGGTMAMCVDFSTSNNLLRVSTDQEELFHFQTATAEVITAPLDVRDEKWASNSCPYTWDSQGASTSFFLFPLFLSCCLLFLHAGYSQNNYFYPSYCCLPVFSTRSPSLPPSLPTNRCVEAECGQH